MSMLFAKVVRLETPSEVAVNHAKETEIMLQVNKLEGDNRRPKGESKTCDILQEGNERLRNENDHLCINLDLASTRLSSIRVEKDAIEEERYTVSEDYCSLLAENKSLHSAMENLRRSSEDCKAESARAKEQLTSYIRGSKEALKRMMLDPEFSFRNTESYPQESAPARPRVEPAKQANGKIPTPAIKASNEPPCDNKDQASSCSNSSKTSRVPAIFAAGKLSRSLISPLTKASSLSNSSKTSKDKVIPETKDLSKPLLPISTEERGSTPRPVFGQAQQLRSKFVLPFGGKEAMGTKAIESVNPWPQVTFGQPFDLTQKSAIRPDLKLSEILSTNKPGFLSDSPVADTDATTFPLSSQLQPEKSLKRNADTMEEGQADREQSNKPLMKAYDNKRRKRSKLRDGA